MPSTLVKSSVIGSKRIGVRSRYGRAQRAILFGLFGLNLLPNGLTVTPRLPNPWDWMILDGLWFRGSKYSIRVERGVEGQVMLDGVKIASSRIPVPGHNS
jgi:cellobiose phosphorylase